MYKSSDCQLFSNKRVAKGFSVNLIPNLIPRVLHLPAPLGQEKRDPGLVWLHVSWTIIILRRGPWSL